VPQQEGEGDLSLLRRRFRAGTAVHSLLTTLCGAAALLAAAAVLDPASLQAGSPASTAETQRSPQQEVTEYLANVISQSERVLVLNRAEGERGCEILLWSIDAHDSGHINADELLLIRHSPLFQTIMVYSVPARVAAPSGGVWPSNTGTKISPAAVVSAALAEADVVAPGFVDRWRATSAVEARMLARGISDMRVDEAGQTDARELSNLHVHLTWSSDSTDGAQQDFAAVLATRRRDGSGPHAGATP